MFLCRRCRFGFDYPETPRKSKCPVCGERCPHVVPGKLSHQRRKKRPAGHPPAWDMLPRQHCPKASLLDSRMVNGSRRGTRDPDWIPGTRVHPIGGTSYREDLRG